VVCYLITDKTVTLLYYYYYYYNNYYYYYYYYYMSLCIRPTIWHVCYFCLNVITHIYTMLFLQLVCIC
jgi:hypothetical protein